MKMYVSLTTFIAFALCYAQLCVCINLAAATTQQNQTTTPQKPSYSAVLTSNPRQRQMYSRQAGNAVSGATHECKDLMRDLHDRVRVLATLSEDQRNRLESIEKKLDNFKDSDAAQLTSIEVQQKDFTQRIDVLEHMQRLTRSALDAVADDIKLSRATRQAPSPNVEENIREIFMKDEVRLNVTSKLDALATLLISTANSVQDLRYQLQANITKLAQATNNIQRRLNGHKRRLQQQGVTPLQSAPLPTATSCLQNDLAVNGILKLQLTAESDTFYVRCEDDWTVILNRNVGDVNFERDWIEYRAGFGNLAGEFFIGLEKLHHLTSSAVHELRVVLEDHDGNSAEARYSLFGIGNEHELYALSLLGEYSGTAGDALSYHAGSKFSTFDNDNDGCLDCNCAQMLKGGWWYNWCATSNLNGPHFEKSVQVAKNQGILWSTYRGSSYSLPKVKMLIRPVLLDEDRR